MRPDYQPNLPRPGRVVRQDGSLAHRMGSAATQFLPRREFRSEPRQIGRGWTRSEHGPSGGASARFDAPNEPTLLTRFLSNHHQRLRLHREIWTEIGKIDCAGPRNEHVARGTAGAEVRDETPPLTRAIRDALLRLRFQRALLAEYQRFGCDGMRRDLDVFETAVAHRERPSRLDDCFAAQDFGPFDDRRPGARRPYGYDARPDVEMTSPSRPQRALLPYPEQRRESIAIDLHDRQADSWSGKRRRVPAWAIALLVAGAFTTGIYAKDRLARAADTVWRIAQLLSDSSPLPKATGTVSRREPSPSPVQSAARRRAYASPVPDSYGLYAVSDAQLTRLEPMRIRVPDPRIAIPGLITNPSLVTVPSGRLSFIAYQRDLRTNAPDQASIRIIAKVSRVLKFSSTGKSTTTNLDDTWAIRPVSFDLTVAPVPDNQEMMAIRLSDPELTLSPGRYMLVFKNQAYDFAVEGAATDAAHCLERTETQNGSVYNECRESDGPA